MRAMAIAFVLLLAGLSAPGEQLFPRHIETPFYPPLARIQRTPGKIVLLITIDAKGNVVDVKVSDEDKANKLLKSNAIENIHHWTFTAPSSAPHTQAITYDYEVNGSLPQSFDPKTAVTFDLPDRVTIVTNAGIAQ